MNICALVGRIGTDPDMRYTAQGTPVVRFRLAVRRRPRSDQQDQQAPREDTDWLTVIAFGRQAELVAQFLDKGALVAVVGRVTSRRWETRDGQRRESVEIVADRIEFVESRAEAERRRAQAAAAGPPEPLEEPPPEEFEPLPDDQIFEDL
jgi:single-strand DNA-binding protein